MQNYFKKSEDKKARHRLTGWRAFSLPLSGRGLDTLEHVRKVTTDRPRQTKLILFKINQLCN